MKKDTIIRTWKAPASHAGLPAKKRAGCPERPAGPSLRDLDEGSLADVVGGGPQPDPWIGPAVRDDPMPQPWLTRYDPEPQPWRTLNVRLARLA
jgi:mersacidin/lichenicidin family type 2 lantibiotic